MEGFGINIVPSNSNLTECCLFAEKKMHKKLNFTSFQRIQDKLMNAVTQDNN